MKDIDSISKTTKEKDLKTVKTMPLKYANEIFNLYMKYKLFKDDFNKHLFDNSQNIAFDTILFAFSLYYNKKEYLSGLLQQIQYDVWKMGVKVLKKCSYNCAARCLEHSLQPYPSDLFLTDNDEIIEKIKKDKQFQNKIKSIVNEYGSSSYFDTTTKNDKKDTKNKSLKFDNTDLFLSLNNTNIQVIGNKTNGKWNLSFTITDRYDFTDFKEIQESYTNNSPNLIGSTANNMAMVSVSCGIINEYNITIKFKIDNYEV